MITERTDLAGFLMTAGRRVRARARRDARDAGRPSGATRGFEVIVVPPFELARAAGAQLARSASGSRRATSTPRPRCWDARSRSWASRRRGVPREPPADAPRTLRFPLPVALPPPGPYRATVGPPLRLSGRRGLDPVACGRRHRGGCTACGRSSPRRTIRAHGADAQGARAIGASRRSARRRRAAAAGRARNDAAGNGVGPRRMPAQEPSFARLQGPLIPSAGQSTNDLQEFVLEERVPLARETKQQLVTDYAVKEVTPALRKSRSRS